MWITERIACPPEAQAFSTASIGLAASPGTIAISPESSPCLLRETLQTAPTEPTSIAEGSILISAQTSLTAFAMISGVCMSMSLPNFDWW